MKKEDNRPVTHKEESISRKEALKKAGKYAAFTAASMLMILDPKESQADSPGAASSPGKDW